MDIRYFIAILLALLGTSGSVWENPIKPEKNICDQVDMFMCGEDRDDCVDVTDTCNGVSECASGMDESVEVCGCPPHEFQCNNTICIDIIKRCDTRTDCQEGNDEEDCETYICPSTHVKCDNHLCVPRDSQCDFVDDCGDGSDEQDCFRRKCHSTEFKCNNSQCLANIFLCDGKVNCADGSDELDCDRHIQCDRGFYVDEGRACDGWVDCEYNQADETNCGHCTASQYRCDNGRCIHEANHCDGVCDCAHTCDDELHCGDILCSPGQRYICPKTRRCIDKKYLCDGVNDCWNTEAGADEYFCWNISQQCRDFKDPVLATSSVVCPEGRCVPATLNNKTILCNFVADCLGAEDEVSCDYPLCEDGQYRCDNAQCIPTSARCDGVGDCVDRSDESRCGSFRCPLGHRKCASGQCVSDRKWCDFHRDCPDNSDEVDCGQCPFNDAPSTPCPGTRLSFTSKDGIYRMEVRTVPVRRHCLPNEFECLNKQCVSRDVVCYSGKNMSENGCRDGSHLHNCYDWQCGNNQFKCRNSYCIDKSQECDSYPDCAMSYWDELHCPFACPSPSNECVCEDVELNCENRGLHRLPKSIEHSYSKYRLAGNFLNWTLSPETFQSYDRLTILDISNNSLRMISPLTFSTLWRLQVLNLEDNMISTFRRGTFTGLSNVKQLYLKGNTITFLEKGSFTGLPHLRALDISQQNIQTIGRNTFENLRSLLNLNLSGNHINLIEDGAFTGLRDLLVLDITNNPIEAIERHVFHGLPRLEMLYTDEYRFCCLATGVSCSAKPDEFSSCQDLMSNFVLRISIWVLGMVASFGNLLVIGWRVKDFRSGKVHTFLITNLALGDFLMGVYLMIIAVVDSYYRGVYIVHDKAWRKSALCKIAGFLSTFSSEISVFTLTVITLDRLVCIIFPFKISRLGLKQARILMAFVWVLVLTLSGVPLLELNYFENFYGRSGVCLPLHITHERPPGWEYSVFLFIGLNFVSFLTIAVSYSWMFIVAKRTHQAVRAPETKADNAMAKRMTLIVMTDFFCWVPIVFLGIASLAGARIPPEVYAWIAVFILPVNSAINPVLYTISTAPFLMNMQKRASYVRKSFIGSVNGDTRQTYTDDRSSNYFERSKSQSQYRQLELIRLRSLNRSPLRLPRNVSSNPDETDDSTRHLAANPAQNRETDTDSEW